MTALIQQVPNDRKFLHAAIKQSAESVARGGFPVGALIAHTSASNAQIIATGISNGKQLADPTSHAEIVAIRQLCAELGTRNLKAYTLYTSLAPCLMCYGAAFWASIPRIVYACPKEITSWQHSEGSYDLAQINQQTRRPIQLLQLKDLEKAALDIIHQWEQRHL